MKIEQIRTIHFSNFPNITLLELRTDSGIVGLGETYYTPRSVTAYIEEVLAPQLLDDRSTARSRDSGGAPTTVRMSTATAG